MSEQKKVLRGHYISTADGDFYVKEDIDDYLEFEILSDNEETGPDNEEETILPMQEEEEFDRIPRRLNRLQEDMIIEFMKQHPQLARKGAYKGAARYKNVKLWQGMTKKLNLVGPPRRPPRAWMKHWATKRKKVQTKVNAIKKGRDIFLSPRDSTIAQLSGMYDDIDKESYEKCIQTTQEENSHSPLPNNSAQSCQQNNPSVHLVNVLESEEIQDNTCEEPATSNTIKRKLMNQPIQNAVKKFITDETKCHEDIATSLNGLHNNLEEGAAVLKTLESNTQTILGALQEMSRCFVNHTVATKKQTHEMIYQGIENERYHSVMERLACEKLALKKKELELKRQQMNTM
ncbi:uncharacterized protein LOC142230021 [Haematobia irritans]|uniref:uncharacterized protein LOC142230021 n=1 Tax=Haematobia irritans TaxID=7368 RepID=UPI003F506B3C